MNISQLEVFAALADTGSFTDTAARVGLTRSAVSHALANLETELGVTLITRERGSAAPTTIGHCLLVHAREALSHIEVIRQEAAAERGLARGKLRLGAVSSLSAVMVSGLLRKFRHEYPGIDIVSFEGTSREVEAWIADGTVNAGFVLRASEGIESVALLDDEVRVMVSSTHPLRHHRTVNMAQIADEHFILPKSGCDYMGGGEMARYAELHKRYEASDMQTILAMVREGLGITILPEMSLPDRAEDFHLISLEPKVQVTFRLGVKSMRHASPAAQKFVLSAMAWASAAGN